MSGETARLCHGFKRNTVRNNTEQVVETIVVFLPDNTMKIIESDSISCKVFETKQLALAYDRQSMDNMITYFEDRKDVTIETIKHYEKIIDFELEKYMEDPKSNKIFKYRKRIENFKSDLIKYDGRIEDILRQKTVVDELLRQE